jgi:hypothetical protein
MTGDFLALFTSPGLLLFLKLVVYTSPLWLPPLLGIMFWNTWIAYVQAKFIAKQDHILLEVRLPTEILKSPQAMELALNQLNQTGGEGTFLARYWNGSVRPWFSLELVSVGGDVHFFIWTRASYRKMVEYSIYSQYPNVEIIETEDYTRFVDYEQGQISLWGAELELVKESAYPLKTYFDYGMDKNPEEEQKIDPLTPVLEWLGSLGPGEQAWVQILIQGHKKGRTPGSEALGETSEALVSKILNRDPKSKIAKPASETNQFPAQATLASEEQNVVNAIIRKASKPIFDVGIRGLYLAEGNVFNAVNIAAFLGTWKQFGSNHMNGFKPARGMTVFDYPWQDYKDFRKKKVRQRLFDAYRYRSFFHLPYKEKPFNLNSEELATLYHFPGSNTQTPTLKRVEAKKAEPPVNLPI